MATSKSSATVKATVVDTLLGNKAFKGTLTDRQKVNFMFNHKSEGIALLSLVNEAGRYKIVKGTVPTADQSFSSWLEVAKVHYKVQLQEHGKLSIIVGVDALVRTLGFTCGSNFNSSEAAYSTAMVNAVNAAKVILRNIASNDSAQLSVDTKLSKVNAMAQQNEHSNHKLIAMDIASALWDTPSVPSGKHSGIAYSKVDGKIRIQFRSNGKTHTHENLVFGSKRQMIDFINTRLTRTNYVIPSKGHGNVNQTSKLDIPSEVKQRQSARRNPANKKQDVAVQVAA